MRQSFLIITKFNSRVRHLIDGCFLYILIPSYNLGNLNPSDLHRPAAQDYHNHIVRSNLVFAFPWKAPTKTGSRSLCDSCFAAKSSWEHINCFLCVIVKTKKFVCILPLVVPKRSFELVVRRFHYLSESLQLHALISKNGHIMGRRKILIVLQTVWRIEKSVL
jgi:hypothetical protein